VKPSAPARTKRTTRRDPDEQALQQLFRHAFSPRHQARHQVAQKISEAAVDDKSAALDRIAMTCVTIRDTPPPVVEPFDRVGRRACRVSCRARNVNGGDRDEFRLRAARV